MGYYLNLKIKIALLGLMFGVHPNSDLSGFKWYRSSVYKFGVNSSKTITGINIHSCIKKISCPCCIEVVSKQERFLVFLNFSSV